MSDERSWDERSSSWQCQPDRQMARFATFFDSLSWYCIFLGCANMPILVQVNTVKWQTVILSKPRFNLSRFLCNDGVMGRDVKDVNNVYAYKL